MRSPDDSSDAPQPAARALDEFEHENGADTTSQTIDAAGNIFVFDCEAQPPVELTVAGELLDVAPALPTQALRPAPLSRAEARAQHHRRRRRTYFRQWAAATAAWVDRIGRAGAAMRDRVLDGSSALSRSVTRVTHRSKAAATASRHGMLRTSTALAARAWPRGARAIQAPATTTAVMYQESNGFVIAVLLAMTVVGYGSFLMGSWGGRGQTGAVTRMAGIERSVVPAAAPPASVAVPGAAPLAVTGALDATPGLIMATASVAPSRAAFTPTVKTVTAMWRRRDTRSLDQAFTALRQQTLAFHRCRMRVTETDRAVARCEGVATNGESLRPVTWTIDFRRKAGRWLIGGVTAR